MRMRQCLKIQQVLFEMEMEKIMTRVMKSVHKQEMQTVDRDRGKMEELQSVSKN